MVLREQEQWSPSSSPAPLFATRQLRRRRTAFALANRSPTQSGFQRRDARGPLPLTTGGKVPSTRPFQAKLRPCVFIRTTQQERRNALPRSPASAKVLQHARRSSKGRREQTIPLCGTQKLFDLWARRWPQTARGSCEKHWYCHRINALTPPWNIGPKFGS